MRQAYEVKDIDNLQKKKLSKKGSRKIFLVSKMFSKVVSFFKIETNKRASNREKLRENKEQINKQIEKIEEVKNQKPEYAKLYTEYSKYSVYDHDDIVDIIDATQKDLINNSFSDSKEYRNYTGDIKYAYKRLERLRRKRERLLKKARKIRIPSNGIRKIKDNFKEPDVTASAVEESINDLGENNETRNIYKIKNKESLIKPRIVSLSKNQGEVLTSESSNDLNSKETIELPGIPKAENEFTKPIEVEPVIKEEKVEQKNNDNISQIREQIKILQKRLIIELVNRRKTIDSSLREIAEKNGLSVGEITNMVLNNSLKVITRPEERISSEEYKKMLEADKNYFNYKENNRDYSFMFGRDKDLFDKNEIKTILELLKEKSEINAELYKLESVVEIKREIKKDEPLKVLNEPEKRIDIEKVEEFAAPKLSYDNNAAKVVQAEVFKSNDDNNIYSDSSMVKNNSQEDFYSKYSNLGQSESVLTNQNNVNNEQGKLVVNNKKDDSYDFYVSSGLLDDDIAKAQQEEEEKIYCDEDNRFETEDEHIEEHEDGLVDEHTLPNGEVDLEYHGGPVGGEEEEIEEDHGFHI